MLAAYSYVFVFWVWRAILSIEPPRTSAAFFPIADAIAEVTEDVLPPPYDDRSKSAALMVSLFWHESRFTLSATDGRSCGLGQTPCPAPKTALEQTRVSYAMVRESIEKCKNMTGYVSGFCGKAPRTARYRESLAAQILLDM